MRLIKNIIRIGSKVARLIPGIGRIVKNVQSEAGGKGKIQPGELIEDVIELGLTAAATFFLS